MAIKNKLNKTNIDDNDGYFNNTSSNDSYIGIFYFINDKLYFENSKVNALREEEYNIVVDGFYKFYNKTHMEYWNKLKNKIKSKYEFNYYPRGRVVCSSKNTNFKIFLSEKIYDKKDLIIKEFNLSNNVDVIIDDVSYNCC